MARFVAEIVRSLCLSEFAHHRAGGGAVAPEQPRQVLRAFLVREEIDKAQLRPLEQFTGHSGREKSLRGSLDFCEAFWVTLLW